MLLSSLLPALPALSLPALGFPTGSKLARNVEVDLAKRDATEVIYLTAVLVPTIIDYYMGYVAYYPTTILGLSGAEPNPTDELMGPHGGTLLWNTWLTPCSGNTHYEIDFPSGVTFEFDLNFGASTASPGTVVGGGWNGFHGFVCKRDNGRIMFEVPNNPGANVYSLINCTRT